MPGAVLFREGDDRPLTIASAEAVADGPGWRIRFREITTRDGADTLRGAYLESVVRADEDLARGTYYWHEVIGCTVRGDRRRRARDGRATSTGSARPRSSAVDGGPFGSSTCRRSARSSGSSRRVAARSWSMPSRSTCARRGPDAGPGPAEGAARDAEQPQAPSRPSRPADRHRRARRSRRDAPPDPDAPGAAGMTLEIDILTLFPAMFAGPLAESIPGRIQEQGLATIRVHDLRDWGLGRHRSVDDAPYGGGAGMILRPEPVGGRASTPCGGPDSMAILLDPVGEVFRQARAADLATRSHLVFVCPRYEGVDERIRSLVDLELSIGDYVLTGGELPALVVIDAVIRLLPGAIEEASVAEESFSAGLLEYPQYTRPPSSAGWTCRPS